MVNRFFYFLVFISVFVPEITLSQASRSDTVDLHHIHIQLDITDFTGKTIRGFSEITFNPLKPAVSKLNLDLLALTVDSILMNGNSLSFQHNDTVLRIDLGTTLGPTDTGLVKIWYHGAPVLDPSNWGGFYFQPNHAFNLGVGFESDPHNFGRAWFPCFDNFVERTTYSFNIITAGNHRAYCNGDLISETVIATDTVSRRWELNQSIPSYLACVAVSDYAEVKWNHAGHLKTIPVLLTVTPADTTKLKNSFIHLDDAIEAYETAYGPYQWSRVGYSIVPFNGGAMEHATNITYPAFGVNNNTTYETLMAHELAHHWWGDLVTCSTAEDMWINEGMASYSESVFLESVYGRERYLVDVRSNHLAVIQYAHITEEKYRAVSGVPHQYTYGKHVYDKGASMAHNLRTYLGDTLFFNGLNQFLDEHAFTDVSSALFRDKLSVYSGISLNDFFTDWIFGAGYAHFSVDSFKSVSSPGGFSVDVFVHQKMRGSQHYFNNVPMRLTLYDASGTAFDFDIVLSGEFDLAQVQMNTEPVMAALNTDFGLNMAVTSDHVDLDSLGSFDLSYAKMNLNVKSTSADGFIRIEHHWAAPDPIKSATLDHRISSCRYWRVEGVLPTSYDLDAVITFDGRNITSGGNGNLDNDLLVNGPDSLILLYRRDASQDWWEYQYYTKVFFTGVPFGRMELDSLIPGEYALANGVSAIGIAEKSTRSLEFILAPNPADSQLRITAPQGDKVTRQLMIYNVAGNVIKEDQIKSEYVLNTSKLPRSAYYAVIFEGGKPVFSGQFVVSR